MCALKMDQLFPDFKLQVNNGDPSGNNVYFWIVQKVRNSKESELKSRGGVNEAVSL